MEQFKIKELINQAVDEVNEQLDDESQVTLTDKTSFIGKDACFDSISFVTL